MKEETSRLYKSRFMEEQIKARSTRAGEEYQFTYSCASCSEDLIKRSGHNDAEATVGFLKSHEWRHT